ncbi:MAG: metal-dependent hydrolase [Hyphomicrobiaceae bacterium]
MANFTTHIAVGTVVSGAAATLTLAADVIAPESLIAVTLAGVVGSVLPDIDLKDSRPSRALFAGLAVFLSFCVLFSVAGKYSIAEMWIAWLGTLLFVRYGVHKAFHHFSYHRGIWHSIVAGVFFWFLTAVIYHRLLGFHEGVAWLAGGFVFVGFLTHLILDEMYSVDVYDTRIKASFGTALKFFDGKRLGESAVVAGLAVLAYTATPPSKPFVEGITSAQLWAGLHNRLLPREHWFGIDLEQQRARLLSTAGAAPVASGAAVTKTAPATSAVTTGSIGSK